MELSFYDSTGSAVAYSEDDELFLFTGEPVAFLERDAVYALTGQHLGWYEDGWLRDGAGDYVLFTPGAVGGPVRPRLHAEPGKAAKRARPLRAWKQIARPLPQGSHGWAVTPGRSFLRP